MSTQPISLSAASPHAALILAHAGVYAKVLGLTVSVRSVRAGQNRRGLGPEDVALLRLVDRVGGRGAGMFILGGDRAEWALTAEEDGDKDKNVDDAADDEDDDRHRRHWTVEPSDGRTSAAGLALATLPLALLLRPPALLTGKPSMGCSLRCASDDSDEDDICGRSPDRPFSPPLSPPLPASSPPKLAKWDRLPVWPPRLGSTCGTRLKLPLSLAINGGSTSVGSTYPSTAYLSLILLPFLAAHWPTAAASIELLVDRMGFAPAGGGVLSLLVDASGSPIDPSTRPTPALGPIVLLERGQLVRIEAHIFCSGRKTRAHVLTRLATSLVDALRQTEGGLVPLDVPIVVHTRRERCGSLSTSSPPVEAKRPTTAQLERQEVGATVVAFTASGCRLAVEGTTENGRLVPEEVGERLAKGLLAEIAHGGCVDSALQV